MKIYNTPSIIVALSLCSALACTQSSPERSPKSTSQPGADTKDAFKVTRLVVYSGRSEGLVGSILQDFDEANPNIKLDVRYNSTPTLANQVIAESEQCPADVLWFQDSGYLSALGDRLLPLPTSITATIPARFQATDKRWIGITGRLRVLVYNAQKLKAEDLPQSLFDLSDSKWKGRLGWAPGNASMHAHVSALRQLWGEEKTRDWLKAMKANAPIRFPKNSPQVKAAHSGEIDLGWVNHYYLHKLKQDGYQAKNYSFPNAEDAGNLLMLSGVGIRAGTKNENAAVRLLHYLLTDKVQNYFAKQRFEYPVREGVQTHPDVTPLQDLKLAKVDQGHLAEVKASIALLNELGIE
jgi:iron(III) transport system substrate-binding protein